MGKKRLEKAEDLNLVPIMNLVTILIPFLLAASAFVTLAVIDSTLPAIGAPPSEPPPEDEEPPLNLSIIITDAGFTVAGAEAVLGNAAPEDGEDPGPTVPCTQDGCPDAETYDVKELTKLMNQIKDKYPDDENVILVPESDTQYEVIIMTMDATRNDKETKGADGKSRLLFPNVVIAGGAE
jgi:biopolymer transport protein ExbD